MMVEVMTPPTIGVAMRFITSAPAPWLHKIGAKPAMMTHAVIAFGRTRFTALMQRITTLGLTKAGYGNIAR